MLIAFRVLLLSVLAAGFMIGCASTKSAYQEAEGFEEVAYVMVEHYEVLVRSAGALDDRGMLTNDELVTLQGVVEDTSLYIRDLNRAAASYDLVANAETEQELKEALNEAARQLTRMTMAIRRARNNVPDDEQAFLSISPESFMEAA